MAQLELERADELRQGWPVAVESLQDDGRPAGVEVEHCTRVDESRERRPGDRATPGETGGREHRSTLHDTQRRGAQGHVGEEVVDVVERQERDEVGRIGAVDMDARRPD